MKKVSIVLSIMMLSMSLSSFMVTVDRLTHICAYSNESVVKFRNATLRKQALDKPHSIELYFDWPVDLCQFWISSLFGYRFDKSGHKKMHNGVDMAATKGTKVKAAASGVVTVAAKDVPGYGNLVEIKHSNGLSSRYAHLHTIDVSEGQRVSLGDMIGKVGSSGNVRGADPSHLHFEIIKNNKRVDPLYYLYLSETNYKKMKKSVY